MAFERIIEKQSGASQAKLTIKSKGWSGKIVDSTSETESDRQFQLDVDYWSEGNNGYFPDRRAIIKTNAGNKGWCAYHNQPNPIIIGISLEHMGWLPNPTGSSVEGRLQFLGEVVNGSSYEPVGAWGASITDNSITFTWIWGGIGINNYHWESAYNDDNGDVTNNTILSDVTAGANICSFDMICNDGGNWPRHHECIIETDLPIFETDAELLAFIQSGGEDTTGILNPPISPREEYELDQKYYYLHNIFTHDYHGVKTSAWYNYRWKPGYASKIRLYRVTPTDSRYYTLVLTVPGGLTRFKGPKGEYTDEDAFVVDEDNLQTHFQEYSYTISRVAPRDVVTVTDFDTNIPIFGSAEDATKYANDELSIEDALNYSDILAYEQQLPEPDFGDVDVETETGINGQTYAAGSAIYVLSRNEMIAFFSEIFKIQDPSFINAFKDGNLLFGDNQANAIIGCQYFPFDASMVCSLESSSGSIWVGGWESQNATGKKVNMNDKVINIGEFFLPDMFKDVRDYEPYTNLYVQLPYCGTYQLSIQKYINKTVKINYAVDIFTGACTALIYANNILLDSMDGMIGSQRPVTGRTAANILQAVTKGSASVAAGAAGGMKAAGMAGSLASGAMTAAAGTDVGIFAAQAGLTAGAGVVGAAGMGALGVAGAGVAAVAGVDMMYKAKNAYADPPMATRGQYSGNLGMFGNQKVHFIVAIRHNYRPENELDVIGFPSGRGGKIGSFSGFLQSSCVYLADGFIGSVQERNEILEMIAKGIYI